MLGVLGGAGSEDRFLWLLVGAGEADRYRCVPAGLGGVRGCWWVLVDTGVCW